MGLLDAPGYSALTASRWRRRDFAGLRSLPAVMASPYATTTTTVTAATVTSGSAITGAVRVPPNQSAGTFTMHGAIPQTGALIGGGVTSLKAYGATTGPQSSASPFTVEFTLDTVGGKFEVIAGDGSSSKIRVAVDGQYLTSGYTFTAPANTGAPVLYAVTGLAAGVHTIRLEFNAGILWGGVNIGPTDLMRATPRPPLTFLAIGDSFTEPTVQDSTSGFMSWGWAQVLSQLLGVEVISSGSGGTGYLQPLTGSGRVKFRDRFATDLAAATAAGLQIDGIIWAGGINDYGNFTASQIGAEAALCYSTAAAALPRAQQIALSPFWPRGHYTYPVALLAARDAIRTAASAASMLYADVLELPAGPVPISAGTFQASTSVGANTVSSSVNFPQGTLVRLGSGSSQEIRTVSSVSGSGPYSLSVFEVVNLAVAHSSGDAITQTGPGWTTGNGSQGTLTANGSADRYTGNDSTHPSQAGHRALGIAVASQIARAWSA